MHNRTQYAWAAKTPFAPFAAPALLLGIGLALAPMTGAMGANMYRWVDADGVTVYSQKPPPDGNATRIRPDRPPSVKDQDRAVERVNAFTERDFDQRQELAQKAKEASKEAEEQAARKANCRAARQNLETIENLGARRLHTPDGEYRYLSDEERAHYESESRRLIQENCLKLK